MKNFASTAASATKVTISAALAVVTVHVVEKALGVHLNGETAEFMGALTVVYHALLHWLGLTEPLAAAAYKTNTPSEPKPEGKPPHASA